MSPIYVVATKRFNRFPRVSGDEPGLVMLIPSPKWFSPRERG